MKTIQKVCVVVYKIKNKQPLFFVARRDISEGGMWQYVTGHVEKKETYLEAAERELNEELGEIKIIKFVNLQLTNDFEGPNGKNYHEIVFSAQIDDVKKLQKEEFCEFKWLTKEEAIELVHWDSHKRAIKIVYHHISSGKNPKIFVLAGPGGGGKGTILDQIIKRAKIKQARTITTRDMRNGESTAGRQFVSVDEFQKKFNEGKLVEKNYFWENWYGSRRDDIENEIKNGRDVIIELDLNGVKSFKTIFPNDVVAIFLKTNLDDLRKRLVERGRDSKEQIDKRMEISKEELKNCNICDYIVENKYGKIDETVSKIIKIINNEGIEANHGK